MPWILTTLARDVIDAPSAEALGRHHSGMRMVRGDQDGLSRVSQLTRHWLSLFSV
jgi:hypothetical protein